MGFGVTSENHPSVTPRFVALVLLILKLRLSLPSLPRAMRQMTKTTLVLGLPSGWAFFGENCLGNPPSAGPRSKASSALILKLLSASQHWQQTSHENKKNKKLNVLEFNVNLNVEGALNKQLTRMMVSNASSLFFFVICLTAGIQWILLHESPRNSGPREF